MRHALWQQEYDCLDKTGWRWQMIRLMLIFMVFLSSGLLTACSGGGNADKPQVDAGAPAEIDPAGEVDSVLKKHGTK